MKKQILFSLLIFSSLASIQHILGDAVYGNPYLNDKQDYEILKQAVFEKMGTEFALKFNTKYSIPSKKSIEKLALCFDYNPSFWFWSNPPQTTAEIGGKKIEIRGTIGDILYDFLVTNANENPKVKALPCRKSSNGETTINPVTEAQ